MAAQTVEMVDEVAMSICVETTIIGLCYTCAMNVMSLLEMVEMDQNVAHTAQMAKIGTSTCRQVQLLTMQKLVSIFAMSPKTDKW